MSTLQLVERPLTRSAITRFIKLAFPLYRNDPNWVAPIISDLRQVFLPANPLFQHARMKLWVVTRDGQDAGRIAGIIDDNHNSTHSEKTAFFGFFESINDPAVARLLFQAVSDWSKSQGMTRLLGPMNPTTNDECGLLVEGFDSPPVVMMTYNPRYYIDLLEAEGFAKAKDLLAYAFDVKEKPLSRLERIAQGMQRRNPDITLRPIRKKTLAADLAQVKEVYNAAWEDNWGFVPMTDAEMDFMAKRMKPLLVENLALVAETPTEPVAFMLSLPDYNEAFKLLNGRLLTPKMFRALPYLLSWKPTQWVRVLTLGIKKEYRQRGIDAMLFAHSLRYSLKAGFKKCEVSWLLEDNVMVQRPVEVFEGSCYKRYRLYERGVG